MKPLILQNITHHPRPAGATLLPFAPYQELLDVIQGYLAGAGLGHYQCFVLNEDVIADEQAALLPKAHPQHPWVPLESLAGPTTFPYIEKDPSRDLRLGLQPYGLCHVPQHNVVMIRVLALDSRLSRSTLTLVAAPALADVESFVTSLNHFARNHRRNAACWTAIHSLHYHYPGRPISQTCRLQDLILDDGLVQIITRQAIGFFAPDVQALHDRLGLPKVRKTLFYGPPGTGKTSLCQAVARALPGISAFHLTPDSDFDDDDMSDIYKHVTSDAPSILLIEDLDTLVTGSTARINVSNFLNLLDGVNSPRSGPALILSTTNHPDKLPESLINRPGRFMPIHVPLPDKSLRLRYLQQKLPDMPQDTLASLAATCHDMSFAHLQEIVLLSGILAMNDGRDTRTPHDLSAAASHITGIGQSAKWGFPTNNNTPFGFKRAENRTG
jgi:hypothetical protein